MDGVEGGACQILEQMYALESSLDVDQDRVAKKCCLTAPLLWANLGQGLGLL